MATDATFPLVEKTIAEFPSVKVRAAKIALVNDHFVPARDIRAADISRRMREFAERQGVAHHFELGRSGISHVLLPNQGLIQPGQLIVGADSHTVTNGALGCFAIGVGSTDAAIAMLFDEIWLKVPQSIRVNLTGKPTEFVMGKDIILEVISRIGIDGANYEVLEFGGDGLTFLSLSDRFTLANMSAEAGAKAGIIPADEEAFSFVRERAKNCSRELGENFDRPLRSDPGAVYTKVVDIDLSQLTPRVAIPPSPGNVRPVSEVTVPTIDQVVIGSCTNGRMSDFRIAAEVLRGKKAAAGTRLIIIPGDHTIQLEMAREGILEVFLAAGATITPPSCGACIGGGLGVLGANEVGVFTTSRNFVGRSGSPSSQVYLVNPWVAATSAIRGQLTSPENL